ncbi:hypothetical protein QLQ12_26995 [Actinoplanes sp. NEAU-A12]|uniref:Sensor histidine kinase n=1 Tax=Actinoplanes sandaracinus TaxID=3045177 RepID=A0ABT6WRB0_9ACTN|nr:hypothetical protein [Actinoplanes sandaracinus]MDI6102270.1 hypothetical protein [Actinoplanes sandaracinus]
MTHPEAAHPARVGMSAGQWVRTVVVIQVYILAAYLAAAIIPYLWAPREYPPTALWIVPGWLLGLPGFYITMLGATLAVPVALVGAITTVCARRTVPARLFTWCAVSTAVMVMYAFFTVTPLGAHIAGFVAD